MRNFTEKQFRLDGLDLDGLNLIDDYYGDLFGPVESFDTSIFQFSPRESQTSFALMNPSQAYDIVGQSADMTSTSVIDVDLNITVAGLETGLRITQAPSDVATSVLVNVTLSDGTSQEGRVHIEAGESSAMFVLNLEMLRGFGYVRGGISTITLSDPENAFLSNAGSSVTYTSALGIVRDQTGSNGGFNRYEFESPFIGTNGSDSVVGSRGRDNIILNGGNDFAAAGIGEDLIRGGPGDDVLVAGEDRDKLAGNDGNDVLYGGSSGYNWLSGGAGDDQIFAERRASISGGLGNDIIVAQDAANKIEGGEGNDHITVNGSFNEIDGGAGDDVIIVNDVFKLGFVSRFNFLFGGDGDDIIYGSDSRAGIISGGNGDDLLYGEGGDDLIYGGAGKDIIYGGDDDDLMYGGSERDIVFGGVGMDRIYGDSGDDTLVGNAGADRLFGGAGNDSLNGNRDADLLFGGDGNDSLFGGSGNDRLMGEDGDDILDGGEGFDRLKGEAGADTFVFSKGNHVDVVLDFEDGIDKIGTSGYTQSEVQTAIDSAFIASIYLILDFGNGDQLRLLNIGLGDITIDDFV